MSQYPVPPPSYGAQESTPLVDTSHRSESEPLLGGSGSISDQPDTGDVPDDFKYGTTVSDCAPQIRKAFIRKVYTILLSQIIVTVLIAGFLSQSEPTVEWVKDHIWAFFVPLAGTLVNLGLLYWRRHTHPWNFVLLSTFTLLEAFTLGIAASFYDTNVLLRALAITAAVFMALSLFTLQTKYEFSGMGPFLFAALIVLVSTSVVHLLVAPFNATLDIVWTVTSCLVFSAFVVYDTYQISARLSPDEFIMGAISLYLDIINLFLRIVRLA
ncbi:UPF0005-domain-containing protein [Mycena rebaudengoi]|nr:UPF0005-domain-containing protein [Mycena rebaudengoi]